MFFPQRLVTASPHSVRNFMWCESVGWVMSSSESIRLAHLLPFASDRTILMRLSSPSALQIPAASCSVIFSPSVFGFDYRKTADQHIKFAFPYVLVVKHIDSCLYDTIRIDACQYVFCDLEKFFSVLPDLSEMGRISRVAARGNRF